MYVHIFIPRNCFWKPGMKYQLLDPFLSRAYYIAGNNKWSETVEGSSLNMTFNLKDPGTFRGGGGKLETKPRVKGCKTPSSKLNTTTAVLTSQLEPSSQAPHKTGLSTTEGPYSLLLTLTDSGKGGAIVSCLPTAESTRLHTKWGDRMWEQDT